MEKTAYAKKVEALAKQLRDARTPEARAVAEEAIAKFMEEEED